MIQANISDLSLVKIHGRTSKNKQPLTLFWTASGIEMNVTGSELWVEFEIDFGGAEPWLSYTIDGAWLSRQMLQKGRYWLPIFRGMNPDEVKNVRLFKDLQPMGNDEEAFFKIHAIKYDGEFRPVDDSQLKIEFIGDSLTSGEGTIGAVGKLDWIPLYFTAINDYAYMTARLLNADYRIFSQSGWGIHCGWDNNIHSAIPKYYDEVCSICQGALAESLGAKEPNDFTSWQPNVIVINLGTNDGGAFHNDAYTEAGVSYKLRMLEDGTCDTKDSNLVINDAVAFLKNLRSKNPKAHLLWAYGMCDHFMEHTLQSAVNAYIDQTGDKKVSYLSLVAVTDETIGSREHPGVKCHEENANLLAEHIKGLLKND